MSGSSGALSFSAALRDVAAEHERQKTAEGWMPDHDDEHVCGEMALAAAAYAVVALTDATPTEAPAWWPWGEEWWKPQGHRRNLVKAGALILSEIERLDRAALSAPPAGEACRKCGGQMKPGKAMVSSTRGAPDFPGGDVVTVSQGGPGRLVECMKCTACGWSVTASAGEVL